MELFYLSQVLKRPVWNARGERVARIKDLVARLEALNAKGEVALELLPPLSGLVLEIEGRDIFIPWNHVRSLGPAGASLASASITLESFQRRDGEVLLARDILDKQLIDIDGRRVIRTNDVQLLSIDGQVRLTAVDVSGEALLRRLLNGRMFAATKQATKQKDSRPRHRRRLAGGTLISWSDIEPLAADVPDVRLRLSHERLAQLHPVDIAHIADELSREQGKEIIESLDDERAADVLEEMDEERQSDIVEALDPERAADVLEEMDPDDAADLLADLDQMQAEDLLRRMDREEAEDVEELLTYEEDTAGGIMTSDFLTFPQTVTPQEVVGFLRTLDDAPDLIDYLYVIAPDKTDVAWTEIALDGDGRLLGIVSLRDLLISPADKQLGEIMNGDFAWVSPEESQEEVARMMTDYNLLAIPVLGEDGRIKGIITVDDAMEILLPEPWLKRLPRVFG